MKLVLLTLAVFSLVSANDFLATSNLNDDKVNATVTVAAMRTFAFNLVTNNTTNATTREDAFYTKNGLALDN